MFFSNAQALVLLQIKPMIVELANCYYPWGWEEWTTLMLWIFESLLYS